MSINVKPFVKENVVLLALAAVKLSVHFWVNLHDQIFRDEFYYIACGNHLDFGYVDHPPFVALMAAITHRLLGDSLFALRLFPAVAGAGIVVLTGLLAGELGGNRFAKGLAALSVLVVPNYLGIHGFFSMNVFDHLFWLLAIFLMVRIVKTDSPRCWILLGMVLGIGLMNKISVLFLGFGLFIGILLTPNRKWFLKKWIWISAGIAFLIFLPHILWQIAYGWPTLEFIGNAQKYKNISLSPLQFLSTQILDMHPFLFPLWAAGLGWLFFAEKGKPYRLFGWTYPAIFFLLVAQQGKPYYLAPIYTILFAAGAVVVESFIRNRQWVWLKLALCTLLVVGGLISAPFALPILSVKNYIAYSNTLGVKPSAGERHELGALPQFFADRYGWKEMVETVAKVYNALSKEEQSRCAIFTGNYGEASAIDYYGKKYGLPKAVSGHNSYFLWGPGNNTGNIVIVVGNKREDAEKVFDDVREAARIYNEYAMPFENNIPVLLCRKPHITLQEAWPKVKHYS